MEKTRATIIVPTVQFGNITYECEGSPNAINEFADYVLSLRNKKTSPGLTDKEFNDFVDAQLMGTPNHVEMYEKASPEQKMCIQVLKRALKRIKSRQGVDEQERIARV